MSGEYGGCNKISHFNCFNLSRVIFEMCGLALSWWKITPLRLTKLGRFSLIAASNFVSCWQYFESIVWPTGSSSKYITPWQSHQTDSKTFFGCNPTLATESAGSFASFQVRLRLMLVYRIHFSLPVTKRSKKPLFPGVRAKKWLRKCDPTCFFRTTNAVPKCRASE